MEKYIFSGNMPGGTKKLIQAADGLESISLLCTQLERSVFKAYSHLRDEGFCDYLMVDSGAYSVFTGKANTTIDQYIDFINENDNKADVFVELDTIPGEWRKSKKPEHYIISAEKSWEDFLYMRSKLNHPEKLLPVFHSGEPFRYLKRMLEYVDKDGKHLDFIGLSAAKDASNRNRDVYLHDVYRIIENSSNPNVRTHLFGTTALGVLKKVPCWSCDSTTHVRLAAFGVIVSPTFGQISVSSRGKKSDQKTHFLRSADDKNKDILAKECEPLHITLDDLAESSDARCAFNMYHIYMMTKNQYAYHPDNQIRRKKLI